jgi:tetratricopeptide (TPR) repeat protein
MATLSVCLIVRNEAEHLDRCLDSIRSLADEVVIADTGSTDETIDLARRRADRLISFAWCDDFAAARNFVLDHAQGDWVLSIDADETIATRDHARIRSAISHPTHDAVESIHRHYLVDGLVVGWKPGSGGYEEGAPYQGYFDVACRRLFRRLDRLRWKNPVHEEIVSLDATQPLRTGSDDWVIHHFGKTGTPARLAAKGEMYLRLGVCKAAQAPDDALAHYELGIQLQELTRWDEALTAMRRASTLEPGFRQSDLYIAICLTKLGQLDEALVALGHARRSTPGSRAEILLEEGNIHQARHDNEKAARAYRAALDREPALAPAAFNLALLALRASDRDQARGWLDRAVTHAPFNVDARLLRAMLAQERGDLASALADLQIAPLEMNPRLESGDPRVVRRDLEIGER